MHVDGAYPRSRGGTSEIASAAAAVQGLSPLTRGNRQANRPADDHQGPIPAHAGEPKASGTGRWCLRAYPRSRGGTTPIPKSPASPKGLSPLTRGNQDLPRPIVITARPIPAHAGEPVYKNRSKKLPWAYPRSRGGTEESLDILPTLKGLSPLTRGNLTAGWAKLSQSGPIPAHAGEPSGVDARCGRAWAYPRSRGGTSCT